MDNKKTYVGEPMKTLENKNKAKNLHQKLLEVRKSIPYIKKDGKSYGYNYAKESQILGTIKTKMDEEGVMLDLEMQSIENVQVSVYAAKEKKCFLVEGVRCNFEFTFTDCDNPTDTIVRHQILQDSGSDVKTIGGLETYANRYFMMKFFNIANDDLDPDAFEKTISNSTTTEDIKEPQYISEMQAQVIKEMLNHLPKEAEENMLNWCQVASIKDLPPSKYTEVRNALNIKIKKLG